MAPASPALSGQRHGLRLLKVVDEVRLEGALRVAHGDAHGLAPDELLGQELADLVVLVGREPRRHGVGHVGATPRGLGGAAGVADELKLLRLEESVAVGILQIHQLRVKIVRPKDGGDGDQRGVPHPQQRHDDLVEDLLVHISRLLADD